MKERNIHSWFYAYLAIGVIMVAAGGYMADRGQKMDYESRCRQTSRLKDGWVDFIKIGDEVFPVHPQPWGDNMFVTQNDNEFTQFNAPKGFGVVGLLAHDYLAGKYTAVLDEGDEVAICTDGVSREWVVKAWYMAAALEDGSNRFVYHGQVLSGEEMFTQMYTNSGDVVIQVCTSLSKGDSSGRKFVIAKPK